MWHAEVCVENRNTGNIWLSVPLRPGKQLHFARISCFLGNILQSPKYTRQNVPPATWPDFLLILIFLQVLKPGRADREDKAGVCCSLNQASQTPLSLQGQFMSLHLIASSPDLTQQALWLGLCLDNSSHLWAQLCLCYSLRWQWSFLPLLPAPRHLPSLSYPLFQQGDLSSPPPPQSLPPACTRTPLDQYQYPYYIIPLPWALVKLYYNHLFKYQNKIRFEVFLKVCLPIKG